MTVAAAELADLSIWTHSIIICDITTGTGQTNHYITVQMQQSQASSPQSQPKHGFETDLMGFLIEEPDPESGRVKLTGEEMELAAIFTRMAEDRMQITVEVNG
ncbi:hypothetical protein ASPWEDRAFT_32438 [Aspergillus wentii DTO 134E9]|uniref:Uncharacterized protein n=1 Tax=Aspergillus wentii DTO 134E9 TaxID=1073089 RepID=A0A1L9R5S9_ASPWE|nr:uncharacterized protein ASPWEDRAFT_32438 [Aspergillus wentii DTO 134E9]OJJ30238.1 hypothetical protein ASPWEDRAFT_32438 [Aspergillus wentii DTO 134E9]